MKGLVHSIDTFSTLDGPGIRTVIFMQGCHLRCKYCHNPDSWEIVSSSAIKYSVGELLEIISRGQPYYKASGGGITFSGGEPLLQHEFMLEVFKCCREMGISTAYDSSLYVPTERVKATLPYTDLVLADIKQIDDRKSRQLTGMTNLLNCKNLEIIDNHKVPIWIRYVVVPGYTDDLADIQAMALLIKHLDSVQRIDLLPYHSLGQHKWKMLGLNYELYDVQPPSAEKLKELAELIYAITGKPVFRDGS